MAGKDPYISQSHNVYQHIFPSGSFVARAARGKAPTSRKAARFFRFCVVSLLGWGGAQLGGGVLGWFWSGVGHAPEALAQQSVWGRLELTVTDPDIDQPIPCRIHLRRTKGRPWKPPGMPGGEDYFVFPGQISLKLPLGTYEFEIERGPEYAVRSGYFTIQRDSDDTKQVELPRFVRMAAEGWFGGDLLVGRGPEQLGLLMEAEDLYVVPWVGRGGSSQRGRNPPAPPTSSLPEGSMPSKKATTPPSFSSDRGVVGGPPGGGVPRGATDRAAGTGSGLARRFHGQALWLEDSGGSYVLVPLTGAMQIEKKMAEAIQPETASRQKTDTSPSADKGGDSRSEVLFEFLEGKAPAESGATGPPQVWMDVVWPYCWDLPLWLALDKVDSIQVLHSHFRRAGWVDQEKEGRLRDKARFPGRWGHGLWGQYIYFQVLECGLRIPPSAGSGVGWAPNPLGYNRVYVHVDGELSWENWWENFQLGRVVVTNGPLLRPQVRGKPPGHEFIAPAGQPVELNLALTFSTRERVQYLEIIQNGRVAHSISFEEYRKSGQLPKIVFEQSGWFLVRAVAEAPPTYRLAMTGPYYVTIGDTPRISRSAVQFFLDWLQQRRSLLEKGETRLGPRMANAYEAAQHFWEERLRRANAD